MFKEILLILILFQSINAEETTHTIPECKNNSSCTKFEKCLMNSIDEGRPLLSKDRVCIPGGRQKWKIQQPPFNKIIKNKIDVEMYNAQVIEIDAHTLTITVSMDLVISWEDHRLQLITKRPMEAIYLELTSRKRRLLIVYCLFWSTNTYRLFFCLCKV